MVALGLDKAGGANTGSLGVGVNIGGAITGASVGVVNDEGVPIAASLDVGSGWVGILFPLVEGKNPNWLLRFVGRTLIDDSRLDLRVY
jgi:hypothetical protein